MALTIALDFPNAKKIGRGVGILSGTVAFDSSYPTGGESATGITAKFRTCLRLVCDAKQGHVFEWDKTNKKIKALYPTVVAAAHAHSLVFKANAAANAVTMAANSLRNASVGDLTVVGAGTDGGIQNAGAIAAQAATEVPNTTDLSALTEVSFIAIGTL